MSIGAPTRVLIVDDSAVVRKMIGDALRREPDIEVVGGAADPFVARDMILQHRPDVITLDLEMPRMDGLTFLRRLMVHHPVPAIVVSSLTQTGSVASIEALRIGAIEVIAKPGGPHSVGEVTERLVRCIRAFRESPPIQTRHLAPALVTPAVDVPRAPGGRGLMAIGASTGGTQALELLLTRLPADMPPIVVVQHMPAGFTTAFAARLDAICRMRVRESTGTDVLERGAVYIAPGGRHLVVEQVGLELRARLTHAPQVHYQRPAVDVLFESVAQVRGIPMVGVLLTGMGADGAAGMVAMRRAGAETIAEAEASCVVFGMPKEAIAAGGACHVASLLDMPSLIVESFGRLARAGAGRAPTPSSSRS